MTDNNENNNYPEQNPNNEMKKTSWTDGNSEMIRMLTVALSSFLGAFLAIALLGKTLFKDVPPPPPQYIHNEAQRPIKIYDAEEMFKEINRDFELMSPKFITPISTPKIQVVKLEETKDSYKLTIDLKQFHDNEKNVKIDVKPNSIKISGKSAMKTENAQSSFSYYQELPLIKKVDTEDVKKEKIGNDYIITLPFED